MMLHPILESYAASNHYGALLEMHDEIIKPGELKYRVKVKEKHLATPIAAHGGLIASLIDASLGVACLTLVALEDKVVSTIELSIKYLKPVKLGDCITAHAEVISQGKRIMVASTNVSNQNGELVAIATGTFNSYPKQKAGY